mmetsp:Transcript_71754/g.202571  ORF Transcript_71754/g.202571 Transcript_71754/m.202571 type:complete len:250 (+) Transcript_71754:111-860(+)
MCSHLSCYRDCARSHCNARPGTGLGMEPAETVEAYSYSQARPGTEPRREPAETVGAEIWTLSGQLLGRMELPATVSAWSLAREIHRVHPPPPGSFWKLVIGTEAVRDGALLIAGAPAIGCIAECPSKARQDELSGEVSELLRRGLTVEQLQLPLESRCMWSYAMLELDWRCNQRLDDLQLPASLRALRFGDAFNQSLDSVRLPAGLRALRLGSEFDHGLGDVKLPEECEVSWGIWGRVCFGQVQAGEGV